MDPREFQTMMSPVTFIVDRIKEKNYTAVADTLERYGGAYAAQYFASAVLQSGVPLEEAYKELWKVTASAD